MTHIPVMLGECLEALNLKVGHWYIDGTFGAGGHSKALLERGVNVLAIDQDVTVQATVNDFKASYGERFKFAKGNFRSGARVRLRHPFRHRGILDAT
jgi:16S rRNA (cytosine1402-N4)-methyltransferase